MKFFILLVYLLFAYSSFAGPATFQGDKVKLFKDKLAFNSGTTITTNDSDDPEVVAKDAVIGSLYIRSTTGVVYSKQDNGSSTNWKPIAKYPIDLEDGKVLIGNASNLGVAVDLSGEATVTNAGVVTLDNDSVIGKTLTGFTSGSGTIAATDSIVDAIEKLDGNDGLNLKLDQTTPQSVVNGAPIFDGVDLNTALANPAHGEGKVFYDNTKKAVSYFNNEADITVNLGQELLFSVCNNTGSTINNGAVVYPDTITGIGIASNIEKEKAIIVAVATHDIENGTCGYVTKLGQVGSLNTSAFSVGDKLYLDAAGGFTTTRPSDGAYAVIVGVVDVVDAVNGIITVDIVSTDLTAEVTDTNGFPDDQRTGTTLSVTGAGPYQFNIAPTGSDFHYYVLGEKFEQTSTVSVVFDDTIEGVHAFYFDATGLKTVANPTDLQMKDVILNYAFVAEINWNATSKAVVGDIWDERHGISMSPKTHSYLHLTRGAQFIEGFGIGDITLGTGALATDAQFSVAAGMIADEDITHNMASPIAVGTTIPVLYITGAAASPTLRDGSQANYAILNAPAGRIYYNQNNAGTWQLTQASDNSYVLYHIFATNGDTKTIFSVMGQNEYGNISSARDGASTEISNIRLAVEIQEIVPIGTLIFQTRDAYTNAVKARIVGTGIADSPTYVDWRTTELAQGSAPTSHANLTNVQLAGSGVTQGHIDDQAQTIYGDKTFNGAISASNLSGTNTGDQDVLDATQLNEVETVVDPIYIKNGGAELALSGWSCSANMTITRNTTTPLEGSADFLLDVTSSAVAGNYCQYAFTATNADMITKMVTASIKAVQYNTTYNNGDIRVCVYDVTAAKCLRTDYFFDTSPKFSADFQIETNSSLALRFEVVTPSVARTLQLDGIKVESQKPSVTGLAGWKQYDISSYITGDATISTINRAIATPYKELDGSWYMDVDIDISVSSATRTSFNISVSGISVNGIGSMNGTSAVATNISAMWGQLGPTYFRVSHSSATTNRYWYGGRVALTTKPSWAVDYSNVVLSSQTSNRDVVFQARRSSSATLQTLTAGSNNAVIWDEIVEDSLSGFNGTNSYIFQEDGLYLVTYSTGILADVTPPTIWYTYINGPRIYGSQSLDVLSAGIHYSHSGSGVFYATKGQSVSIISRVQSQNVSVYNPASPTGLNSITITKLNTGSQTIAKDAKVVEKWTATSGTFSSATTLTTFTSPITTTHGWFTPSTGEFKSERDGFLDASIKFRNNATLTYAIGDVIIIELFKNGISINRKTIRMDNTSHQTQHQEFIVKDVKVSKGDVFKFVLTSTVSYTISANGAYDNEQSFSME